MVPNRFKKSATVLTDILEGQYEKEYNCRPPPVAMIIMSIIQIIFYVYDSIMTPNDEHSLNDYIDGPAAKLFIYDPRKRHQGWRYLTYMFVHLGILHLLINLIFQIILGIPLEMVHKWWRVLIIYLAGVVAGSLGISVLDQNHCLAGASSGNYALRTAHIATILMNWSQMNYRCLQLCVLVAITALEMGPTVYDCYVLGENEYIRHVAHLAGAAAGLLIGISILRNLEVRKWKKVVRWASISTYIALIAAAILWHVFGMKYVHHPYN